MQLRLKLSLSDSLNYTFNFIADQSGKKIIKWEFWGSESPREHLTSKSLSYEDPLVYGPTILSYFTLNSDFQQTLCYLVSY